MFSVTISEKGGQQSKIDFSKPEITIGRMKGNDIVLPKSNVSKQHTRIFLRDERFFIVDLKSTNGTYVNGRKVMSEQPLSAADKIYIGDFILQLENQPGQRPASVPPSPPHPPGGQAPGSGGLGPGVGGPGGGRHFPTVLDGPQGSPGSLGSGQLPSGQFPSSPQSGGSQPMRGQEPSMSGPHHQIRQPSSPGGVALSPTPTPAPSGPRDDLRTPIPGEDDLRRTIGDPFVPSDLVAPASGPSPTPPPSNRGQAPAQEPSKVAPGLASRDRAASVQASVSLAGARALALQKPLKSEFDPEFHLAEQDVAKVFFESIAADDLPLNYPVEAGLERSRIEEAVTAAIQTVGPGVDRDALSAALTKEALGLGPLEDYLDDDAIQSIYINAYDQIILRRQGELVVAPRAYSHPTLLDIAARRLLGPQDAPTVFDEVRFSDGTRVHILMPPVAVDGPVLTVRKPKRYFPTLDELVDEGALSAGMAEFLRRAVQAGRSIAIAGPTSSGKSTLLAALTAEVAESTRLIAVEQHSSLPLDAPSFIRLEASPSSGLDLRFLLSNAVAMHPERIVLDECRGAEAYEWVTAAASGTVGSMVTLNGLSAIDALGRLESMCLLGALELSPRGLREQIARSVDLVVALNSTAEGTFLVHQIAEVQGVDLDAFRVNDIFYHRVDGASAAFHPTGYIPLFYEDLRHAGFEVDLDIFRE